MPAVSPGGDFLDLRTSPPPPPRELVAGARSRAEVEANVRLLRQPIPQGFWQELKAEDLLPAAAPVPDATDSARHVT